jgi:hypothetical protein
VKGGDGEVVRVGSGSVLGKRRMRLGMETGRMTVLGVDRENARLRVQGVKRGVAEDKKEWQIKGLTRCTLPLANLPH